MENPVDYSHCPPKKRPIVTVIPKTESCSQEPMPEPQDLRISSKKMQDLGKAPPVCASTVRPTEVQMGFPEIQCNFFTSPATPLPNRALETPPSVTHHQDTNKDSYPKNALSILNVSNGTGAYPRHILCQAPSITPVGQVICKSVSSGVYTALGTQRKTPIYMAPPSPRSPLKAALKERGAWRYHPYLPLAVYGLPSAPFQSVASPKETKIFRSGSVSPPGGGASSSSESSPEGIVPHRLSCSDCGRRYATIAGLTRHRQFHCLKDSQKSFSCKHCDKVYTTLGALKMHIRTHTLPCKCHLCGKAFSRPWLLQGHIRTHTGEKPFQCQQCDRSFADRSNLRAHLQTHAEVKKYACRTCPKTFSRMSLLVKHEDHGCPGFTRGSTSKDGQSPL